jgi:MerR family transcriptional regulator, redox-sensitive transcriptional activator SoxR
MSESEPTLSIGQVADRAGVPASTIRYYESVGVLPEAARLSGQRRYASDIVRRLAIVDVAQRAGFTLAEIRDLLSVGDDPAYRRLRSLAERKLPEVDALIRHAQAVRRWLELASACECDTLDMCALFDDAPASGPP